MSLLRQKTPLLQSKLTDFSAALIILFIIFDIEIVIILAIPIPQIKRTNTLKINLFSNYTP